MKYYLKFTVLFIFASFFAKADIRIEGTVMRMFSISNINKFPAYQFYYLHQSYHYDQGYKADKPDTVAVENGKRYEVATRGNSKTSLMAVDAEGNWMKSEILMGGEANAGATIKNIVDVYEISSIKEGALKIKKVREITLYKDGKEKSRKASAGFFSMIGNDGFSTGLTVFSFIGLLGLLTVFIIKKRKHQYPVATA